MTTELGGLVDADNGLVSRRIFIEPEIYAQELERIFARSCLAPVSQRGRLDLGGRLADLQICSSASGRRTGLMIAGPAVSRRFFWKCELVPPNSSLILRSHRGTFRPKQLLLNGSRGDIAQKHPPLDSPSPRAVVAGGKPVNLRLPLSSYW